MYGPFGPVLNANPIALGQRHWKQFARPSSEDRRSGRGVVVSSIIDHGDVHQPLFKLNLGLARSGHLLREIECERRFQETCRSSRKTRARQPPPFRRERERFSALQSEAFHRFHGRRGEVRAGRRALRRRRQFVVFDGQGPPTFQPTPPNTPAWGSQWNRRSRIIITVPSG